ncbi:MAG: aspartate kinase [Candidatus Cloacimonetes bacterium]|nr:aspartate kinase [Candidatus Cloacimonadota bacterium]
MSIIVKKFGGTSVGSIERIRNIAKQIASAHRPGEQIVLVVSAMAKTTDELFALAYQISGHPSRRETDMLLTAGERISMSLLSLALQEEGFSAISFTGSQSGIITDTSHGNARIIRVNAFRIHEELDKGNIVIVAGFQGVSTLKEITTLGRGGSDTSAVALACYLKADKCEIFTDVDGVFTADPRLVKEARKLPWIDYETMLALAYNGSKVLHPRAVEFAYKYQIPVEIKSSFTFAAGTLMSDRYFFDKGNDMEEKKISAIAHKQHLTRFTIHRTDQAVELLAGLTFEVFKYRIADGMIYLYFEDKNYSETDHYLQSRGIEVVNVERGIGFVILVGIGINLDMRIMARLMELTADDEIRSITHSDKTIELEMPSDRVAECLLRIHHEFIGENK